MIFGSAKSNPALNPSEYRSKPPAPWLENVTTAFTVGKFNGDSGSNSKAFAKMRVWEPIISALNDAGVDRFENPAMYLVSAPLAFEIGSDLKYNKKAQEIFSYISENQTTLSPEMGGINEQSFDKLTLDFVMGQRAELEELYETNPGLGNAIGRFVGSMGAAMSDPIVQATIPFGGWSKSLWKRMAQNALIGGGTGAISEVAVKDWYEELGIKYTYKQFVYNVAANAAFGAALPVAGSGLRLTVGQAQKGWRALTANGTKNVTPEDQLVIDAMTNQADLEGANPFVTLDANEAISVHNQRLETASAATANAEPVIIPQDAGLPIRADAVNNLDGVFYSLDPMAIEVDAKTFQFKEGGDEFGVTDRLQGVTIWDKYKAGVITVYEYANGKLAVADGHQRLGLAKRIMSQDPSQDVKVIAYKLREADGITPEQARVIAAMKNIAEGTGTAIDAAKILRVDPSRLSELPPKSELVRQARDMIVLGDGAFQAVINGVVPANQGAIVGRLISDPAQQTAAINILAKASPSNQFQAEAIVRQVREAGYETIEQTSLFGDEVVAESFYVERAKILDRTYKELRRDKAAFETLVRNADRLEAEGNVLAKSANERKAATDGQTIALLQALANRKGPLSDALNDAAKTARSTGNYSDPTSGFVDAVRRSIDSGDFESIGTGDIGRSINDPAPIARSEIEEPALDGFDEPTGIAAERQADQLEQDMFRVEEVTPDVSARSPNDIEADLKARQPVETVDDIYALADESQSYIATIAADIESDLGVTFKNPGLKDIDATKEKMQRKGYTSANQITDVSRGGFIVNKAEDADAIVARFGKEVEGFDEGWNFTPSGYFDRKLLVRTPNGIVSEIQIWSPKLLAAKEETGTKLYTKMRESKDPAEVEAISLQMRELYANALKSEDQSFRSLSGIDNLPKVASNADINAASSGITRPVSKTSGASTDVQAPPGSRIATASDAEMEIAGRPSQLTNIMDDTSDLNLDITSADVNLDLEFPMGQRINADGDDLEVVSMTFGDLKKQLDQEQLMVKRLEFCTI